MQELGRVGPSPAWLAWEATVLARDCWEDPSLGLEKEEVHCRPPPECINSVCLADRGGAPKGKEEQEPSR